MIGTSFIDGIIIHGFVIFFRYTPLIYTLALSGLYLTYGVSAYDSTATKGFGGLLLAEALFYGLIYVPYTSRLNGKAIHPPPLSSEQRWALFNQCMTNVASMELYMRWWFQGAEMDSIRKENLRDFLLWAFFDREAGQILHDNTGSESEEQEIERDLDGFVAQIEQRLGHPLHSGRGSAKCIRLTFDDIETTYRSLAWYIVIFIIDQATHAYMSWHGFKYYAKSSPSAPATFPPRPQDIFANRTSAASSISYWYSPQSSKDCLPVVFFHGIGVGLWTYARFLADINAAKRTNGGKEIGVIAVETLPISFRLTALPPTKADFLESMANILDHHGWNEFVVASHSYGSVQTTHMLHCPKLRDRIKSVVLIDPVTIMLHLPDVAYNFTRRRPKKPNEWQLWYFASTDPSVAHCLGRHFFWRENIIWKEDLLSYHGDERTKGDRRVAVCLAGRDILVNTSSVAQYLTDYSATDLSRVDLDQTSGVEVLFFPTLDHAQVFDSQPDSLRLVRLVRSYCCR